MKTSKHKPNMHLDPFFENDQLASRPKEDWPENQLKISKRKATIKSFGYGERDGDEVLAISVKSNEVEIYIESYQHRLLDGSHKCDFGHYHPVLKVEPHFITRFSLTGEEAIKIGKFLLGEKIK